MIAYLQNSTSEIEFLRNLLNNLGQSHADYYKIAPSKEYYYEAGAVPEQYKVTIEEKLNRFVEPVKENYF